MDPKEIVSSALLDEVGAKASNLYREGRDLLAGKGLCPAAEHFSDAIRKNPLAAIGIAFSAGLLVPLLTRGWQRAKRGGCFGLTAGSGRRGVRPPPRRAAVPAALGSMATFSFRLRPSLFSVLFFWLESLYGPSGAVLIVAAVAYVAGLITMRFWPLGAAATRAGAERHTASGRIAGGAECALSGPRSETALAAFLLALRSG